MPYICPLAFANSSRGGGTVWEGEAPAEPKAEARQEPRPPRIDQTVPLPLEKFRDFGLGRKECGALGVALFQHVGGLYPRRVAGGTRAAGLIPIPVAAERASGACPRAGLTAPFLSRLANARCYRT